MEPASVNCTIYPDRESWLASRADTIGASDVATIVGANPYKSAYALWAEKRGHIPPEADNIPMRVGRALEPEIAAIYTETTGTAVVDPGDFAVFAHPDMSYWTCTPDRLVTDGTRIARAVELKSIGEQAAMAMKDGEPPLPYSVQLQSQMAVLGIEDGDLACLIGHRAFEVFPFKRHNKLIAGLAAKVREFHERVLNGDPPPVDGSESTARALAALWPEDIGDMITLDHDAVLAAQEIVRLKAAQKEATAQIAEYENFLAGYLKEATGGTGEGVTVTYKAQTRKAAIRVEIGHRAALMAAGIEYKETAESTFRVLRITGE